MSNSQHKIKRSHSLSSLSRLKLEYQPKGNPIDVQALPFDGSRLAPGIPLNEKNKQSSRNHKQRPKTFAVSRRHEQFVFRPPLGYRHQSLPSTLPSTKDKFLQEPLTRNLSIPQSTDSQLIHKDYFDIEPTDPQQTVSFFSSDSSSEWSQSDPAKPSEDRNSREISWMPSQMETLDLPNDTPAEGPSNSPLGINSPIPIRPLNNTCPLPLAKQYSTDLIIISGGLNMPEAQLSTGARHPPDVQPVPTTKSTSRPQPLKITTNPKASIFSPGEIKRRASKHASGLKSAARENFNAGVSFVSPVSGGSIVYTPSEYGSTPGSAPYNSSIHAVPEAQPHTPSQIPPQPPTIQEEAMEGEERKTPRKRKAFALRSPKTNNYKKNTGIPKILAQVFKPQRRRE
ncbi:hypothetical protein HYFRA_00011649 [Hymenoscyphus fraxineus]|uniref:Uncharacterized protein n=1 Tax=Hymenoscyphus fraxineus TaxID=746836 RepID=A0A9N9KWR8_9HELO|nr:hypothetical protein HYFRA_00011649 [Hymenoscyphus fraxineus]